MLLKSMEPAIKLQAEIAPSHKPRNNWWLLPLVLPYLGLLFPQLYTRSTPALLGFPFFYWYQLGWVILASSIMGVVYHKLKS
jgi:hypothetical protein